RLSYETGADRLHNALLERAAELLLERPRVLNSFSGPIEEHPLEYGNPVEVTRNPGTVISVGKYSKTDEPQTIVVTDAAVGQRVWFYVDENGVLVHSVGEPPSRKTAGPLKNFCILGSAVRAEVGWTEPLDGRRYIRSTGEGPALVVGDVWAGADFETLQQALDFIEARDMGGRGVVRRIILVADLDVSEQIHVSVPDVRIEARPRGVEAAAPSPVEVRWSYCVADPDPAEVVRLNALIDLHGMQGVTFEGIRFVRKQAQTGWPDVPSVMWDPGDQLTIKSCESIGRPLEGKEVPYTNFLLASPGNRIVRSLAVESCTVRLLAFEAGEAELPVGGLIAFLGRFEPDPEQPTLLEPSTGCLWFALVRSNRIHVDPPVEGGALVSAASGSAGWITDENWLWAVVDCGKNPEHALGNRIEDNVISGGVVSIRVGSASHVSGNEISQARCYGVLVENGRVEEGDTGASTIAGNRIGMATLEFETPEQDRAQWPRSGIRLRLSRCLVKDNTIDLGANACCGITEGPIDGLDPSNVGPAETGTAGTVRVAANERAHGVMEVQEASAGVGFTLEPSDVFQGTLVDYTPDRTYYLAEQSDPVPPGPRTIDVRVWANVLGPTSYLAAGEFLLCSNQNVAKGTARHSGVSGVFDAMRSPMWGGHAIEGNMILRQSEGGQIAGAMPEPKYGLGIALLSSANRVCGNRVQGTALGVLALDSSVVADNFVGPAWLGICAWKDCTVRSNRVWWHRTYCYWWWSSGLEPPRMPLFPELPVFCGIQASVGCVVDGNEVAAMQSDVFASHPYQVVPPHDAGYDAYMDYLDARILEIDGLNDHQASPAPLPAAHFVMELLASVSSGTGLVGGGHPPPLGSLGPLTDLIVAAQAATPGSDASSDGVKSLVALADLSEMSQSGQTVKDTVLLALLVQLLCGSSGVMVANLPMQMLLAGLVKWRIPNGPSVGTRFIELVEADFTMAGGFDRTWLFLRWGGNTVTDCRVDLGLSLLPGLFLLPLQCGIATTWGFEDPKPVAYEAPHYAIMGLSGVGFSSVSSCSVRGCNVGYVTFSADQVHGLEAKQCGLFGAVAAG
ncbi:MAG: hypothetical protein QG597_318, partial [Actinomycetota bacterium]|nr:hypothetical protein [Actinomycetota bacterium]